MTNLNRIFKFFRHLKNEYPNCEIKGNCQWDDNRDGIIEVEFFHNNMNHSMTERLKGTGDQTIINAIDNISRRINKYFDDYNARMDDRARYLTLSPEEQAAEIEKKVAKAMKALQHIKSIMEEPE